MIEARRKHIEYNHADEAERSMLVKQMMSVPNVVTDFQNEVLEATTEAPT